MAIVVKHGNHGSAILGAFGGGLGKRQAEDARLAAQLGAQEQADKRRMGLHTNTSLSRADRSNVVATAPSGGRSGINEIRPSARPVAAARSGGGGGVIHSSPRVSWDAELAGRHQAQAISDQARRIRNMPEEEFVEEPSPQLSNKQIDDRNARWEAYQSAAASGEYTPEELADAKAQLVAADMGVEPFKKLEKPVATPEELFRQQTYRDPESGALIGFKDGIPFKLADAPKVEGEFDDKALTKEYRDMSETLMADNGGVAPSPQAVANAIAKKKEAEAKGVEMLKAVLSGDTENIPPEMPEIPGAGAKPADWKAYEEKIKPVREWYAAKKAREARGVVKGLMDSGAAASEATLQDEDSEAETWAKSNPDDPRAKEILEIRRSRKGSE